MRHRQVCPVPVRHDKQRNPRLGILANRANHEETIAKGNHHVLKNFPGREFPVQQGEDVDEVRRPSRRGRRGGASWLCTDARTMPVDASMRQPSRKPSIAMTGAKSSPASGKIMNTLPFRYRRIVNKGRARWLFEGHRVRYVIGKLI
jgi:hypothetical protein